MKKLSIIIPVYNVEKYLERCLKQLSCQLVQDIEVILINDGSPDGCGEICQRYADRYEEIKYVSQENGGVSRARNRGIDIAVGEYITFIDPDDTISETYIERILCEIKTHPDLLILKYQKIIGKQIEDGPYNIWDEGVCELAYLKKAIGYLFLNEVWNKVFRTELIKKNQIRFTNGMKIAEDVCFVLDYVDCIENAKVAEGIYYYYWSNAGSAIRVPKPEHLNDLMTLYSRLLDFSQKNGMQDGSKTQPSDFILQNIEELFEKKQYSKVDIIEALRKSELCEKLRECKCHGINNRLLFYGVLSLVSKSLIKNLIGNIALIIYQLKKV